MRQYRTFAASEAQTARLPSNLFDKMRQYHSFAASEAQNARLLLVILFVPRSSRLSIKILEKKSSVQKLVVSDCRSLYGIDFFCHLSSFWIRKCDSITLLRFGNPAQAVCQSKTRQYHILVHSDVQTAKLPRMQFSDCEASANFTTPNSTVSHICYIDRSEREASVNSRHPRDDSYTLSQYRSLRT